MKALIRRPTATFEAIERGKVARHRRSAASARTRRQRITPASYEVVDGEADVTSSPSTRHQEIVPRVAPTSADHLTGWRASDDYRAPTALEAGATLITPRLTGLGIDVADLLAEAG